MKRTEIKYEKIGKNKIKIIKIKNIATFNELCVEFGSIVANEYCTTYPEYIKINPTLPNNKSIIFFNKDSSIYLAENEIYTKQQFCEIINAMKTAEDKLQCIKKKIKEEQENKIKTIII